MPLTQLHLWLILRHNTPPHFPSRKKKTQNTQPTPTSSFRQLQTDFQTESNKVSLFSEKLQTLQQALARVQTQITESEMVKKELDTVKDGEEGVYKLIGTALVKQELPEAQQTIDSRLGYLNNEKNRLDKEIESVHKDTLKTKETLDDILKKFHQLQQESQQNAKAAAEKAKK